MLVSAPTITLSSSAAASHPAGISALDITEGTQIDRCSVSFVLTNSPVNKDGVTMTISSSASPPGPDPVIKNEVIMASSPSAPALTLALAPALAPAPAPGPNPAEEDEEVRKVALILMDIYNKYVRHTGEETEEEKEMGPQPSRRRGGALLKLHGPKPVQRAAPTPARGRARPRPKRPSPKPKEEVKVEVKVEVKEEEEEEEPVRVSRSGRVIKRRKILDL